MSAHRLQNVGTAKSAAPDFPWLDAAPLGLGGNRVTNSNSRTVDAGIRIVYRRSATDDVAIAAQVQTYRESELALLSIYAHERSGHGRLASQIVLDFIERNFAKRRIDQIEEFLASVDPSRLSILSLIGIVRASARASLHLPSWSSTYKKCRVAAQALGHNPDKVYVGIRDSV